MSVVERVPLEMPATRHNLRCLRDKRDREGHLLVDDGRDAAIIDGHSAR